MALADTARLIASLELQDKFSTTARKFDSTVAGMDNRTRSLEKIGENIGRGTRTAITNIGKIAVFGAGAIASQVALGIKSLGELAEANNQTNAVLKSTGGIAGVTAEHIREQAEALEDLSTVDDKVIQRGENMLLTFKNIRNEVGEGNDIFDQATKTLLDMSVALGSDPQKAAIQLGKALNDPIKGITALTRVGVTFTDQQRDQITALTEAGKTMQAQKIILAELNSEFGNSAKAFGEGPAADMRRFGDAVEGAQQALATGFLPLMTKVSQRVQEALGDPQVLANITKFGESAAAGVDQLISIGEKLPWGAIGQSAKLLGQGSKALLDAFTAMPPWVQTAVLTGWGLNKLTGGALGNIAGELTKLAFGSLRGSTPATPVFTKEVGIPGVPGGGTPVTGAGRGLLSGVLKATIVGAVGVAIAEGLRQVALQLDPGSDARKAEFQRQGGGFLGLEKFFRDLFGGNKPQGAATPIGQFNAANAGGVVPVKVNNAGDIVPKALFDNLTSQLKINREAERQALKEGDIHQARLLEGNIESIHDLRGTVNRAANTIIPHLGETNRALSKANRNLEDGNARQREMAQRIAEARDRIGTGFRDSNAQLGIIARKDFSPNVNVTVPVTTSVSLSDVVRNITTYNVATSYGSQLRRGFQP